MNNRIPGKLRYFFETVKESDSLVDHKLFMNRMLTVISKIIDNDQSLFIFQDEDCSIKFILNNIYRKYADAYLDYFYSIDPFRIVSGTPNKHRLTHGVNFKEVVVNLQELISMPSFLSSEYYNDFYRPQNIHYELMSYLKSGDRLLGLFGFYRHKKSNRFSKVDIEWLKTMIPYISKSYENILLHNKLDHDRNIFKIFEDQFHQGILFIENSMKLIYQNNKAKQLCEEFFKDRSNNNRASTIPPLLLEDCHALKQEFKIYSGHIPVLPKNRIIEINSRRYTINSQFIEKEIRSGLKKFFIIRINEISTMISPDEDRIRNLFNLTKREMEIINHIFQGKKNFEIAETLFVSEVTIKNHIHNIFQKVQVKNRTSLIRKLLELNENCPTLQ